MNEVVVESLFDTIQVKINGTLHLRVKTSSLLAIQSWRTDTSNFGIEYTLAEGGMVFSEYSDEAIWRAVLDGLERTKFDQSRQS